MNNDFTIFFIYKKWRKISCRMIVFFCFILVFFYIHVIIYIIISFVLIILYYTV